MSGRRRRKAYRKFEMDLSGLNEGVYISREYKRGFALIAAVAFGALIACGITIGYFLGKRDY